MSLCLSVCLSLTLSPYPRNTAGFKTDHNLLTLEGLSANISTDKPAERLQVYGKAINLLALAGLWTVFGVVGPTVMSQTC